VLGEELANALERLEIQFRVDSPRALISTNNLTIVASLLVARSDIFLSGNSAHSGEPHFRSHISPTPRNQTDEQQPENL